ncbi:MAG: hypothetical protein KJO95_12540 [Gammaproteobacteria bacterium]|nr:hypothetical protein [Gammaproteobacteria bacterium]MBU2675710.1 hypothetical protein [Gammaproteobacteria bacterium]NNC56879.1 hypothetical protein [Woeseiaceae bacterium]NNL49448.1 hypothetical protein [Woeseiaceae bacterium]
MKKSPIVNLTAILVFALGAVSAVGQETSEEPVITPVETYTCNYNEGKGPADLDKVIDGWSAYMDEQGADNYFAMTLTPHYFGAKTFDVGWLGSAMSAEELGAGADAWMKDGAKQAAAFASVITCDSHSNFATMQIKESPGETAPDNIVLTFSNCSAVEGNSMEEVFAAMDAWTAYSTENGYRNGTWVMFPAYGVDDADFDFKLVNGYDNHTDMGKDYDHYANGGGYQKHAELLGGVLSCDITRVYDGVIRRRIPAAE